MKQSSTPQQHSRNTWLQHHCYTTSPLRFAGIINPHLIITGRCFCADGFVISPEANSSLWPNLCDVSSSSGQVLGLTQLMDLWNNCAECSRMSHGYLSLGFLSFIRVGSSFMIFAPCHKDALFATAGWLLNLRITKTYCVLHILSGSVSHG